MDQEETFNVLEDAYERRTELRQQLQQRTPQVKETVLKLFDGAEGLLALARPKQVVAHPGIVWVRELP